MGFICCIIIGTVISAVLIELFEDKMVEHSILWKKQYITGEILWFEECSGYHCCYSIAVIKVQVGDTPLKCIVNKSKSDEIGDLIKVATDGAVAVRTKWYRKEDRNIFTVLLQILLVGVMLYFIVCNADQSMILGMVIGFIEVIAIIALYPLFYTAKIEQCRKELGWH